MIPNAVCMHEEDAGIALEAHRLPHRGGRGAAAAAARHLDIATVGNYEYGYFWYLYTDGTIEYEVKLTGVISTGALRARRAPDARHDGRAPGSTRPHHQHFFCVRLDMAVDGNAEHASSGRLGARARSGRTTRPATAWVTKRDTVLETEARGEAADRPAEGPLLADRERRARSSALGDPVAYKLMPGENVAPMYRAGLALRPRARASRSEHVWVTALRPVERFAAGDYPNQHPGGDGLPRYAAADRPTEGTDVVLWYMFGAHHIVAAGGLAGDAGDPRRLQAQARRLLRRQPGAGHAAVAGPRVVRAPHERVQRHEREQRAPLAST